MDKFTATTLCTALLAAPTLTQQVTLKVSPAQDAALHFNISSKLNLEQTRKILLDGEPMDFGGRGGGRGRNGNGPTTTIQTVSFDEGKGWRQYDLVEAVQSDASGTENKVAGALAGKKIFLTTAADGSRHTLEGEGDAAKPLAANLSRGLPGQIDLAGFLPSSAVEIGKDFDLSSTFRDSLRNLMHPVAADRSQTAGNGQGGRGQRGRRGRRGSAGASRTIINLLNAPKLGCAATGNVTGIQEIDGAKIVRITLQAKLSGEGSAEDLGIAAGGRGGRGGGQATSAAKAALDLSGYALFNTETGRFTSIELSGSVNVQNDSTRDVNFRGMEGEMQTKTTTVGKVDLKVQIELAK